MAILESTIGTALQIDPSFNALRASIRPPESLAWNSFGVQSGALTGLSANATIFSLRNSAANPVIIRRVGLGLVMTTAFTAAQLVSFGLSVARGFTASDTSGTVIAVSGSNGKHRTSLATPSSIDARISVTATLGQGTRTLDANTLTQTGGWSAGVGTLIAPALNNLFAHDPEDYPLILAQNEGIVITSTSAWGAAGVGTAFVTIELAEASAF